MDTKLSGAGAKTLSQVPVLFLQRLQSVRYRNTASTNRRGGGTWVFALLWFRCLAAEMQQLKNGYVLRSHATTIATCELCTSIGDADPLDARDALLAACRRGPLFALLLAPA